MIKITLAQINPTIGDIEGNIALMRGAALKAVQAGATMVVFPELCLTGYYPADLLEDPQFSQAMETGFYAMREESRATPNLYWVVGAPTKNHGAGKPLHNSLLVIKNGEVLLVYHKQLLPTYNVFDERRHFEPGPEFSQVLKIGTAHVGFMICEDGWNDAGTDYAINPFLRLGSAAPDLVISINASPSNIGKRELRHSIFKAASTKHNLPLLYVNQVGGHDQLVYDGASFAVHPKLGIVHESPSFEANLTTVSFDPTEGLFEGMCRPVRAPLDAPKFYYQQIVLGLKDYARRCGFKSVVVGSSGGIDSAVTLALAADALGAENVVAITMPSEYSSAGSVDDSVELCRNFGIPLLTHPIKDAVEAYKKGFKEATGQELRGLPLENLQARIRGTILMEYSNSFGHLLLTTGNKSEISVGYCTLYGDTNGGLGLIGDLYKTEVFTLARYLNSADFSGARIPVAIIDKPPSAELAPGQKDTDSLPPYPVLDEILKILIEGVRLGRDERLDAEVAIAKLYETEEGTALVKRVSKMISRNEYKRRQAPPIIRVRSRAFGSGRQMPIAAKY